MKKQQQSRSRIIINLRLLFINVIYVILRNEWLEVHV